MMMFPELWEALVSDGCLFALWENDELAGVAGIHVDDFLIGKDDNEVFMKALKTPRTPTKSPTIPSSLTRTSTLNNGWTRSR